MVEGRSLYVYGCFVCVSVCPPPVFLVATEAKKGVRFPGAGITLVSHNVGGYWKPNHCCSLEEQPVFLIAEPSFQPLNWFLHNRSCSLGKRKPNYRRMWNKLRHFQNINSTKIQWIITFLFPALIYLVSFQSTCTEKYWVYMLIFCNYIQIHIKVLHLTWVSLLWKSSILKLLKVPN